MAAGTLPRLLPLPLLLLPPLHYAFKKGCVSNAFSCLASLCFALLCFALREICGPALVYRLCGFCFICLHRPQIDLRLRSPGTSSRSVPSPVGHLWQKTSSQSLEQLVNSISIWAIWTTCAVLPSRHNFFFYIFFCISCFFFSLSYLSAWLPV